MAGIVATFGAGEGASAAVLASLISEHLAHRGPDGVGVAVTGRAVLAHARVAGVGRPGGRRPVRRGGDRARAVVHGGSADPRRRRSMLSPRHRFASACDSEVVLHLFQEFGAECVRVLDGMFAFFVTDGERFLAARDPFGIKPLYVGTDAGGGVWFASELKALQ